MHRVGLSSPSPSGISPEGQVFRKTSSIMRFGNFALSDRKVTVTAERQPSLEWGGGGEASACEPGNGKISIALNKEPELQWGNSITAPLRWFKPAGDVRPCSTIVPIRWEHPSHGPQRAAQSCHHPWWWLPSNLQTGHRGAFYHQFPSLQLECAKDNVWMQSIPHRYLSLFWRCSLVACCS